MAKILLTDAEYGELDIERRLIAEAGHELIVAPQRTADAIAEYGRDADGLLVQFCRIDASLLKRLPTIRVISRYGVGVDNIDLIAATAAGVCVANVPDYGTHEVATHTAAMALALLRGLVAFSDSVRSGRWDIHAGGQLIDPSTATVGLLGLGRIGRKVGELLAPSVCRVLGFDPIAAADPSSVIKRVGSLSELLSHSNLVSLHMPLSHGTRNVIGAHELSTMPHPRYIVNTARGGILNETAVLAALEHGELQGAALDVVSSEPPDAAVLQLVCHPRVISSPHVAWLSTDSIMRLREGAVRNLLEWLETGRCRNAVTTS